MTASAVVLTAALLTWKAEIEERGATPLEVAVAQYDAAANSLSLAADTPRRDLFAGYLRQEEFVKQFMRMYAVMVHHKGAQGNAFLVLVNGAREQEWKGHEEALVAHEFGHAWLRAQGYPAPVFLNNESACVAIHAGDIVQHVLIRRELDRRHIDHRTFWLKSLESAAAQLEKAPAGSGAGGCGLVQHVAHLVDARLGLERQERYEATLQRAMPEAGPAAAGIVGYLGKHDVTDKAEHRAALGFVFERLRVCYARREF